MTQTPEIQRPKVFLTYSWHKGEVDEAAQMSRVRSFAEQLLSEGIDVLLDQFDVSLGDDVIAYMERSVNDHSVTHVLALCDRSYKQKFDAAEGGAGTEGTILKPHIYQEIQDDPEHKKFIAAVWERGENNETFLPTAFQSKIFVDLSNAATFLDEFIRLRNHLYNRPLFTKPPVAPIPLDVLEGRAAFTSNTFGLLKNLKHQGYLGNVMGMKLHLAAYLRALTETIGDLPIFPRETPDPGLVVTQTIQEKNPYLLEWADLLTFAYGSEVQVLSTERLLEFLEGILGYRYGSEREQRYDFRDTMQFFVRQVFMYAVAALLHFKRWEDLRQVLGHPYAYDLYPRSLDVTPTLSSYDAFSEYLYAFTGDAYERGRSRHAQLIQQLPQHPTLGFAALMEADAVLLFYSLVKSTTGQWAFRELRLNRGNSRFFSRARNAPGARLLREVLGVTVPEVVVLQNNIDQRIDNEFRFNHHFSLKDLFNLRELAQP